MSVIVRVWEDNSFCIDSWRAWCRKMNYNLYLTYSTEDIHKLKIKSEELFLLTDDNTFINLQSPDIFALGNLNSIIGWRDTDDLYRVYTLCKKYSLDHFKFINENLILTPGKNYVESFLTSTVFGEINRLIQKENLPLELSTVGSFRLSQVVSREWLGFNWQRTQDKTPHMLKYGFVYQFHDLTREIKLQIFQYLKSFL